jgi:hypothetical protein
VSTLAASLAQRGIATIAINGVGDGFGTLRSLTVNRGNGDAVTFSSGGRGFDQNGDGLIDAREGLPAARPRTEPLVSGSRVSVVRADSSSQAPIALAADPTRRLKQARRSLTACRETVPEPYRLDPFRDRF